MTTTDIGHGAKWCQKCQKLGTFAGLMLMSMPPQYKFRCGLCDATWNVTEKKMNFPDELAERTGQSREYWRYWFVGQALNGLCSNSPEGGLAVGVAALGAISIADAILAALEEPHAD